MRLAAAARDDVPGDLTSGVGNQTD